MCDFEVLLNPSLGESLYIQSLLQSRGPVSYCNLPLHQTVALLTYAVKLFVKVWMDSFNWLSRSLLSAPSLSIVASISDSLFFR